MTPLLSAIPLSYEVRLDDVHGDISPDEIWAGLIVFFIPTRLSLHAFIEIALILQHEMNSDLDPTL